MKTAAIFPSPASFAVNPLARVSPDGKLIVVVADEPSTVIAFLTAYIRALQDLADPESAADALALIQTTDLSVDPELADGWLEALAVYAPFDGGFGSLDVEGGLGEGG